MGGGRETAAAADEEGAGGAVAQDWAQEGVNRVLIASASAGAVALETWPELSGAEAEAQRLRRELAGLRAPRAEARANAAACPQVAA